MTPRSRRPWAGCALLLLPLGCLVDPVDDPYGLAEEDVDEPDGDVPVLPVLSGAVIEARCDAIKATAAARGIQNPLIVAGIANHETHLVQCLSEWPIHCAGPHSADCGGPVLAGSGDGPCGNEQGGLGMFQFDAGTYGQTLAMYGNQVLDVAGNIDGGIDVIIHKLRVCQHTKGIVGSDQAAIDFINEARPGTDAYEKYMSTMASCYNGCQPHYTTCSHEGMRAKYKAGVDDLLDRFGEEYWYAPPAPTHGVQSTARVGTSPTGRLEVFALGDDGRVHHRWQPQANHAFADWADLGGALAGPPVVGHNDDGRLEVFGIALDGSVHHRFQAQPGTWGDAWEDLGGASLSLVGEPAVARNADGRLEVFVLGEDGEVFHKWQQAASTPFVDAWSSFGEGLASRVVLVPNADGRLEAFSRSEADTVVHRWQVEPSGSWSGWHDLGGSASEAPAVGINADGRLEVFVVGTDGALRHRWQRDGGGWASDWVVRDGTGFVGTPAVASNLDGRMELMVRSDDGRLWHAWQLEENLGFADGWRELGNQPLDDVAGDPQFGRNADGRVEVFVRRGDGTLWHTWQHAANQTWADWEWFGADVDSF